MMRLLLGAACLVLCGCQLLTEPPPDHTPSEAAAKVSSGTATRDAPPSPDVRGFSEWEKAALRLRNVGCGPGSISSGSGFAISEHAFVTNRHVVEGSLILQVSTFDGRDLEVEAAGVSVIADIAVVRTKDPLPSSLELAKQDPEEGSAVTAVGYPLGGPLTSTTGRVLSYGRDSYGSNSTPMLINDAPIEHGSSGSPLVDERGLVVGVAYAGRPGGPYYAVPVEVLSHILADPQAHRFDPRCAKPDADEAASGPAFTTCSDTVSAGPATSCVFALAVEEAWTGAGRGSVTVRAHSPVTGLDYDMRCEAGNTFATCEGGNRATVLIHLE